MKQLGGINALHETLISMNMNPPPARADTARLQNRLVLSSAFVVRALTLVAALLLLANLVAIFVKHCTDFAVHRFVFALFDFDTERNLPTFFSGCLLLINSLLLLAVWRTHVQLPDRRAWFLLAGLFTFLAFDEFFGVHERLSGPVRDTLSLSGVFFFSWIVAYGAAALALSLAFAPIWWRLESHAKRALALAAALYLSGALGMEMIGGWYFESVRGVRDATFALLCTVEETLEISGSIVMLRALLGMVREGSRELTVILRP
jgi:hypothetical protein